MTYSGDLKSSLSGMFFGKLLKRKFIYDNNHIIFFPEDNDALNICGLHCLKEYMSVNDIKSVTLLALKESKPLFEKHKSELSSNIVMNFISEDKMLSVMDYLAVADGNLNWLSVSFNYPYKTYAERLIGFKGVTLEKLVRTDIFEFDDEAG